MIVRTCTGPGQSHEKVLQTYLKCYLIDGGAKVNTAICNLITTGTRKLTEDTGLAYSVAG